MKLFPTKTSERAALQNLWLQRVTEQSHVDSRYSECEKKIAGNFNFKPLATEQIDQNFKIILSIQGS